MPDSAALALDALRHAHVRLTAARRAVIEVLADSDHLTAPAVVEAVSVHAPDVSRASVYRTLELLIRLGLCQVATMGGPVVRYTLTPSGKHHHIVCMVCNRSLEFERCGLNDLLADLEARSGFSIHGHLLEAYGLCPECRLDKLDPA